MNDTLTVYKDGQTKIIPKTLESDYVRAGWVVIGSAQKQDE